MPLVAPLRPLLNLTDGRVLITRVYQLLGGAPKPLVKWAFQLSSFQKLVTKPLAVATHLDDADFLAQIEAVDRFTANMIAYPGRTLRAALPPVRARQRARAPGRFDFGDRTIELSDDHRARCWSSRGATDGIAPIDAVKAVVPLLTGSAEVRFEIVPGGHLGMLTGRAARGTTWRVLDEWVDQWSTPTRPPRPRSDRRRRQATGKKTAAKKAAAKSATKKSAAEKTAAKKKAAEKAASKTGAARTAAASKPAADADAIGVNPTRRYGSAGSRSLAR